jgi:hypothetical protein
MEQSETPKVPIHFQDLSQLSENEKDKTLMDSLESLLRRSFNLSRPPIIKVNLFELNQNDYQLQVAFPHLIMDGFSMQIWWNELNLVYNSLIQNKRILLPVIQLEYNDYLNLENEFLMQRQYSDNLFWLGYFKDSEPFNVPYKLLKKYKKNFEKLRLYPIPRKSMENFINLCKK